ncbi:OmpA family protein [Jannaschia formosa]|nr:OmpA family protein [Jannaschia formosa]TFL19017.1 OmpA family protein [Jannaschia formosa]
MHNRTRRFVLAGLGLGALGACTGTRFNDVAGAEVDEGGFGNPTMRNMVAMSSGDALGHLGGRFAGAVPTTINFAFNSAQLGPEARAILDQQANFMRQFPEVRFSVYGHTDAVGSDAYNVALGRRRAVAAVDYLTTRGISRSRLDALVSFGESRLLVPTDDRERANRRTVTEVAGFVKGNGLVLDGKYAQIVYRSYVASAGSVEG